MEMPSRRVLALVRVPRAERLRAFSLLNLQPLQHETSPAIICHQLQVPSVTAVVTTPLRARFMMTGVALVLLLLGGRFTGLRIGSFSRFRLHERSR